MILKKKPYPRFGLFIIQNKILNSKKVEGDLYFRLYLLNSLSEFKIIYNKKIIVLKNLIKTKYKFNLSPFLSSHCQFNCL